MVVVGDRDLEAGAFTVRRRGGEETLGVAFDRIVEVLSVEAAERRNEPSTFG
jgi:threonyl-tRNA synthetase